MDVTPTQLEWRGEGVSFPVANNQTAEGRARNHRVEISIPSLSINGRTSLCLYQINPS